MDNLIFSINVVAPLVLLMVAGYCAKQFGFVNDKFMAELNRFVFNFLIPLMLFQNIRKFNDSNFTDVSLMIVGLAGLGAVAILSLLIVPFFVKRSGQRGSVIQGIYRSNFLIFGMPLATGMYGQEAAQMVAMMLSVVVPFFNISAVIILSIFSETRKNDLSIAKLAKDVARNPLIIGCLAGLLFGLLRIDLPAAVNKPINDLCIAAPALALFLMGGEFKFKSLNKNLRKVLIVTFLRLIIIPLAAMIVFIHMGFNSLELSVLLCLFATPTAVNSYIMASNMGCDGQLSGQIVVFTTVGSCLSIFLFILTLKSLGYF